uniref:Protein atonal homolog 8 n=1 Tax=Neogobius melanostomus TaxID=47308 RepID=A0A8C6SQA1_9GOBI
PALPSLIWRSLTGPQPSLSRCAAGCGWPRAPPSAYAPGAEPPTAEPPGAEPPTAEPPGAEPPTPEPRTYRPQYEEEVEHNSPSPKQECVQRLRPPAEGSHVPEVKALQQTRRLLANARERTRVHTISAAFEALRKQVPCYSYGQKLSKLAILRIACNYILSLAQLAEMDYSSEQNKRSFSHCVEQCTRTLQAEGRSKKKKVRAHSV